METSATRLRHLALSVAVLDDLDITPTDTGILLPGVTPVAATWQQLAEAARLPDHTDTNDEVLDDARERLRLWCRLRSLIAGLNFTATDHQPHPARVFLTERIRAVALPQDHVLHPGDSWTQHTTLGGALDVGLGIMGLNITGAYDEPLDEIVPLPADLADIAGIDAATLWPDAIQRVEAMGVLAVQRLRSEGQQRSHTIRPVGGIDVLTLLVSPTLRSYLAHGDSTGMRAVACPARDRGWYDLARIDPAYIGTAWSLTDRIDRGHDRALLVTEHEVALARRPANATIDLQDDVIDLRPFDKPVRFR